MSFPFHESALAEKDAIPNSTLVKRCACGDAKEVAESRRSVG
jgi:hypothetical protein